MSPTFLSVFDGSAIGASLFAGSVFAASGLAASDFGGSLFCGSVFTGSAAGVSGTTGSRVGRGRWLLGTSGGIGVVGTGISLESGGASGGVSDDFAGAVVLSAEVSGFAVCAVDLAVGPTPEEPAFLSGGAEHPTVAASTPATIEADQRNEQEKSNRIR